MDRQAGILYFWPPGPIETGRHSLFDPATWRVSLVTFSSVFVILAALSNMAQTWLDSRPCPVSRGSGTPPLRMLSAKAKEGWTEVNPGTRVQHWDDPNWPTTSHPVKYAAGGYYVLAIEDSADAHLLSPDHLGVDLTGQETVTIRFQNHTPATRMRLRFTTEADAVWDDAKSRTFTVVADDNRCRTYDLDMSAIPAWKDRLKQLRLDLATGEPITGTCRFDFVWITRPQPE